MKSVLLGCNGVDAVGGVTKNINLPEAEGIKRLVNGSDVATRHIVLAGSGCKIGRG